MTNANDEQLTQSAQEWRSDREQGAQSIDFIVTEDCNLRCKYCYICHKQSNRVMTFDVAKKFIDYLFSGELEFPPAIILGFIGGEPMIEVNLIDQIVDYFKIKAYLEHNEWYWNYRISITTNGVNYGSEEVQKFIAKNREKLSLTITLDGTKEKHDMQRVFPDGSGSYDVIVKNIPQYIKDFYPTTKVTFAHADLPLLKESIIHLWNLGITDVSANCVYENVWQEGDDKILEEQLKSLADYMIETECFKTCAVSFFEAGLGHPLGEEGKQQTVCGAGLMLGVGPTGKIYPCLRYKDYSLEKQDEIVIGDIEQGIDFDKVLRFRVSTNELQFDDECLYCPIAFGCQHCQAQSYDSADTPTNFQRSKYICAMHKARIRANNYFYNRLYNEKGIDEERANCDRSMYFVLSDDFVPFCECANDESEDTGDDMSVSVIEKGLEYCEHNFYTPVFIHSKSKPNFSFFNKFSAYRIQHLISAKFHKEVQDLKDYILVFDKSDWGIDFSNQETCILNVEWSDVGNLSDYVIHLLKKTDRVNLNMIEGNTYKDLNAYQNELRKISQYLLKCWTVEGRKKEFNKITDILFCGRPESCTAGEKTFSISPAGNIHTCPIAYMNGDKPIGTIGDLEEPHSANQHLYSLAYAPLCKECPATHCVRCAVTNRYGTGEVNVPPESKCKSALTEYRVSKEFRDMLESKAQGEFLPYRMLNSFPYDTPYDYYADKKHEKLGFRMKRR